VPWGFAVASFSCVPCSLTVSRQCESRRADIELLVVYETPEPHEEVDTGRSDDISETDEPERFRPITSAMNDELIDRRLATPGAPFDDVDEDTVRVDPKRNVDGKPRPSILGFRFVVFCALSENVAASGLVRVPASKLFPE
jgi:hypothetical protein